MNTAVQPTLPCPAAAVSYVLARCTLGTVLIAATDRGVCAMLPGDDPGRLVLELRRRFPHAVPATGERVHELADRAVGLLDGRAVDLPLDPRGTRFERRVWEAIGRIPPGSLASYADLARRIGAPGSARAVGRACASNTIAVAIPCHRVVRSDGGLGGYRWGLGLKREVLARESAA